MTRLTGAEVAAHKMLLEAVAASSPQHVLEWLIVALADHPSLTTDELEIFGNRVGRMAHMKGRR